MRSSIQMVIEEVKRLSNLYENRVPSVLLFETLFKAEEIHKQEIMEAFKASDDSPIDTKLYSNLSNSDAEQYYQETFKKD